MLRWFKKILVIIITAFTFGLAAPPQSLACNNGEGKDQLKRNLTEDHEDLTFVRDGSLDAERSVPSEKDQVISRLLKVGENQSYIKFGDRIKPVIEDEFKDFILPKMEEAINKVVSQYGEENLCYLEITEQPNGGRSEKIFHIFDKGRDQDLIRFHVRKEHPPQEGYWFNFHYHLYEDQFQTHYNLGSIYWDKNTPPKWMK